ncbi:hypothetical protein K488DRAFT_36379, partial [Vararia minispora EC-137]
AWSKRTMEARESKKTEDAQTCIFMRSTHVGEAAIKELILMTRPHAISFQNQTAVRPFEGVSALEFWAQKNDASMFAVGKGKKKQLD